MLKALQELDFAEYWINQSVFSPSNFKNIVKCRIKDQYVQMPHKLANVSLTEFSNPHLN
jgi:hypothetical protein